jgi:phospholipid/cholesterol/gamma-HCH transport system substrate-binding protein
MKDRRGRNVTAIGALVLGAAALFVWGFFYLLGDPVLSGGTDVVVALDNGVGLKRGDRVQLQGVAVGTVRMVELMPPRRVSVVLRLDDGLRLPADTRVIVRGDVFGAHTVDLLPGSAMVMLEPGDTIRGVATAPLPQVAGELSEQARSILTNTDSLLSRSTVAELRATASVLPATAIEMRAAFAELHLAARALRHTGEELRTARTGESLNRSLAELEESARAFNRAAVTLDRSLGSMASVMQKIDTGEGTLGRLVNDTTLYSDLNDAVREMRALAVDIRANPKRYVNIRVF